MIPESSVVNTLPSSYTPPTLILRNLQQILRTQSILNIARIEFKQSLHLIIALDTQQHGLTAHIPTDALGARRRSQGPRVLVRRVQVQMVADLGEVQRARVNVFTGMVDSVCEGEDRVEEAGRASGRG